VNTGDGYERTHALEIASWMLAVKVGRSVMLEKAMLSSMTEVTTVTSPVSHCVTGSARQMRSCQASMAVSNVRTSSDSLKELLQLDEDAAPSVLLSGKSTTDAAIVEHRMV
jgi:hypothetical protein